MLICSHHIGDFTALRARHFTTHAFFTTRCGRTSREVPGDWRAAGRGRVAEGPPSGFSLSAKERGRNKSYTASPMCMGIILSLSFRFITTPFFFASEPLENYPNNWLWKKSAFVLSTTWARGTGSNNNGREFLVTVSTHDVQYISLPRLLVAMNG